MSQGLLLHKDEAGFRAAVAELDWALAPPAPAGETLVTIAPEWSTLNYKDGLALTDRSPVVRRWPMVAGIDAAGRVLASEDPRLKPGDLVVSNGFGAGETHWGGLATEARLRSGGVVRLPAGMSARTAMAIGTAGYTAMLCVMALQASGWTPQPQDEVLVTGATGGVGSVAVALLARLGCRVVALTGKDDAADYLKSLGAAECLPRQTMAAPGKPLQKERWAAVVDTLGSHTLANACAQTRYGGRVAACGLAQGPDLPATVMPFILRGVQLLGVDSVMAPLALREAAWARLAEELPASALDTMTTEIALADAPEWAQRLMAGQVTGRVLVRLA